MKKIILSLVLLLSIPTITFASIDTNLYYGIKNQSQVKELQEFLIDKGLLTGEATGNFYSLTLKAVKKYQESQGLPTTGFVGSMTRGVINQELADSLKDSDVEVSSEPVSAPVQEPTQAFNYPLPTQPVVETIVSKKDIIIEQTQVNSCIMLKSIVLDDNGERILDNRYPVKVTADTFPNRITYIGILNDNNEYLYCEPEGENHLTANITYFYSPLNLRKTISVTP